jgi:hypothetical protein
MSDLVELARKYVTLSDQLEAVRSDIKRAVMNGGAMAEPRVPFSRPARPSGGSKPKARSNRSAAQSLHPKAIAAARVDQEIVGLLKTKPGLKTGEIAKATSSKVSTTVERLRRMTARGLAQRDGDGAYTASA